MLQSDITFGSDIANAKLHARTACHYLLLYLQVWKTLSHHWQHKLYLPCSIATTLHASTHNIHTLHTHQLALHTQEYLPNCLPQPYYICTQLTNTIKHSWRNDTSCRDDVNVLWFISYLVWLVLELGFHPYRHLFSFRKVFCDFCIYIQVWKNTITHKQFRWNSTLQFR